MTTYARAVDAEDKAVHFSGMITITLVVEAQTQ